ncbi:MAG: flagellar biosynthetic protein FliO [Actinobacteria bacterium]|nr:flagellar biosynthetic protein FliO [Actinomycetota bacterium]MCG2800617.1 flagellar biosynthetic protein FliO [Cellulomonas sp.]
MDSVWLFLRVVVALACVLGVIWIAARRLNGSRAAQGGDEPHVRVVDRSALGRHAGVAVLAVGNRRILVGYGEQRVEMLTELNPVVVPLSASAASSAAPRPRATSPRGRTASPQHPSADRTTPVVALVGAGTRTAVGGSPSTGRVSPVAFPQLSPTEEAVVRGASPLAGSVLSPQSWKDAMHALQERTVRR